MYDDSMKIPRPLRSIQSCNHSSLPQDWIFVLPGVILLFVCGSELIQCGGLRGRRGETDNEKGR